ncbi:MAG: hypothetical protein FD123_1685 [Bacteroidetes bacterium]|nr:MAG: hypothetical protein FD123_1685 [Bacteroidota bacterium]
MAVKDKVNALYQALSTQEKRYISIWLGKENEDGKALLDLLNTVAGKNGAKTKTGKSASSDEKRLFYLYQAILRALRSYHEGTSVNLELYSLQMNVEFLFNRRLYDQSLSELERLKKSALKYNRYPILLSALELEQAILLEKNPKNMKELFVQSNKEILAALSQIGLHTQLGQNRQELFYMLRNMFNSRDEEKLKRAEALMQIALEREDEVQDFMSRHHLLHTKSLHALYKSNWKEASKHYSDLVNHWEQHPDWISADAITYKKMLSNFLSTCHAIGDIAVIPPLLEKIKSIPCNSAEEEAEQFQNIYFIELLHLINTDAFEKLPALEKTIVGGLKKYKSKINKARELMFYYNFFVTYFCLHDWKTALDWINKIINSEKNDHRADVQALARLLRLVLYFELSYFDLLEYELINVERYLRQRKIWYAYEAAVARLLKKLIAKDEDERIPVFAKFIEQMTEFGAGRESPLPAGTEMQLWANYHITGTTMRRLLREEDEKNV